MAREVSKMRSMRVETDPAALGFDGARLERIDRYFARYVDDGRLASWLAGVARDAQIAHVASAGPASPDTIWRIASMTKPITSVAAMMLWEEGAFELKDPVSRFIPEFAEQQVWRGEGWSEWRARGSRFPPGFAEQRVWRGGSSTRPALEPVARPMEMWHLM